MYSGAFTAGTIFSTGCRVQPTAPPKASDVRTVTGWLERPGVSYRVDRHNVHVEASSVRDAESLLATTFHTASNAKTKQSVVRAGDFFLPERVEHAVAAVFGLHGLPLPPKVKQPPMPHMPPSTPTTQSP